MTITEDTRYPVESLVKLTLTMNHPEAFALQLRIPFWSANTEVRINGVPYSGFPVTGRPEPGTYLSINRRWKSGDAIELALDFKLRIWYGDNECKGKISVYRGPVLCTYDARFNSFDPDKLPEMDAGSLVFEPGKFEGALEPWVYGVLKDKAGSSIVVCDFSSAGQTGNQYRSWLPLREGSPAL
jgi:hypothetical protein